VKYMLLIYGNPATWDGMTEADYKAHADLIEELTDSGELVATEGLTTADARIVRAPGGATVVTDGPFTEAKEVLAGYYLVDCAGAERATEIAARLPETRLSLVEVRRVMDPDEVGI
jgi:hypothetical protein